MDVMTTYPVNSGQRFRLDIYGMDLKAGRDYCDQFEYRLTVDEGDNDGEVIGSGEGYYGVELLNGNIKMDADRDIVEYIKGESDKYQAKLRAKEFADRKRKLNLTITEGNPMLFGHHNDGNYFLVKVWGAGGDRDIVYKYRVEIGDGDDKGTFVGESYGLTARGLVNGNLLESVDTTIRLYRRNITHL